MLSTEPKTKLKRKPKHKGQRSGCTMLLTLMILLGFLALVLAIKGPFIDKPIVPTAVILRPSLQALSSPVPTGASPQPSSTLLAPALVNSTGYPTVIVPAVASPLSSPTLVAPVIVTAQPGTLPPRVPRGQIAYVREGAEGFQLAALDVDGSNPHLIKKQLDPPCQCAPPPGMYVGQSAPGQIVYSKSDAHGHSSIYLINIDGSNERQLTDNSGIAAEPMESPDGKLVAYRWRQAPFGLWQIYVVGTDGTNPHNLTGSSSNNFRALWMPDGKHISFVSDRALPHKFYVMDADGSNVRRLPFSDEFSRTVYNLYWSPDGKYVAFSKEDSDGPYRIYIANIDGSGVHRVSAVVVEGAGSIAWTGDSKTIVFTGYRPMTPGSSWTNNGLWMVNIDGTNLHQLVDAQAAWTPAWIP